MSVADAFNQLRKEAKTSSTLDAMLRCDAQFRLLGSTFRENGENSKIIMT